MVIISFPLSGKKSISNYNIFKFSSIQEDLNSLYSFMHKATMT